MLASQRWPWQPGRGGAAWGRRGNDVAAGVGWRDPKIVRFLERLVGRAGRRALLLRRDLAGQAVSRLYGNFDVIHFRIWVVHSSLSPDIPQPPCHPPIVPLDVLFRFELVPMYAGLIGACDPMLCPNFPIFRDPAVAARAAAGRGDRRPPRPRRDGVRGAPGDARPRLCGPVRRRDASRLSIEAACQNQPPPGGGGGCHHR